MNDERPGRGLRPVLLASSLTAGGSAKAATRLLRGLRSLGLDAQLLSPHRGTGEEGVVGMFSSAERCLATAVKGSEIALRALYPRRKEVPFSSAWLGCRIGQRLVALQPSVVHLHQCHNGFLSLSALREQRCPLVWTIHDWWPLTGGCHFPDGCERHRVGCGQCPVLGSRRLRDLSRLNYARKSRAWSARRWEIAAVSSALASELRSSPLFRGQSTGVIPNGFDTEQFRPLPKATARSLLGLPATARILLFGAKRSDANKGFAVVRHLVEALSRRRKGNDMMLVVFGDNSPLPANFPVPAKSFGLVDDDLKLALLYSAADITLVPSRQESFGLVAAESMACGTPVLAFRTTGLVDIVDHQINGYLADPGSQADYEAGAAWLSHELGDAMRGAAIATSARVKAVTSFDVRVVAKRYVDIYTRLLAAVQTQAEVPRGGGVT